MLTDKTWIIPELIAIADEMIKRGAANGLPAALQVPSHQFHTELVQLLTRYTSPAPPLATFSADENALLANPNVIFTNARMSFHRLPVWAYDSAQRALVTLQSDTSWKVPCEAEKRAPSEARAHFQARTVNTTITDDTPREHQDWRRLTLDEWLPGLHDAAERVNDDSTWLQYWRTLLGQEGSRAPRTIGETVVEMKLSAMLLLFMMCNKVGVERFPTLGEDGVWRLPDAQGNGGKDEHLFVGVSRDAIVRVA